MTDSKNSEIANSELEEDEDVEHLYPIQNMDVLYEDDSADDDSMQDPGALVETEMYSEGQEGEEVMDENGEEIDESYSMDQELEMKTYIEDFIYSNVDDGSSNPEKEEGKGSHLSRFQTIVKAVGTAEYETLQVLYQLLYQRSAWDTKEILSQRILEFSGFSFSLSSEEYFNREMMLQTQPTDVLIKLAVVLGLDHIQNSGIDVDKARLGLIRCIMSFLLMPNKKTQRKGIVFQDGCLKSNDGIIYSDLTKCGCRNLCFSLIPKAHREIIRDYVKSLMVDRLLDSYLVNMIKLKKITRRQGYHAERRRHREITYSYFVKYDAKLVNVCKGAFMSIYDLRTSKMNQLQNRIKTGQNLPKKMDLKDFPPMPVPSKSLECQSEDASEVVSTVSPRKRRRRQKKYVPSEDENQSEEDSEIEVTNQVIKTEKQLHSSKDNQAVIHKDMASSDKTSNPDEVSVHVNEVLTLNMKVKFLDSLKAYLVKTPKSPIYSKEKYCALVKIVKRTKGREEQFSELRREDSFQPRLLKKYDVIEIAGTERLIVPGTKYYNSKYYVHTEEMFDILHETHLKIGHGGRTRMEKELQYRYKNVTKEAIMMYLRLCRPCQEKLSKMTIVRKVEPKPAVILFKDVSARGQVDIIDMQSNPDGEFKFILNYQDFVTKFVLLKPLKSKGAEEIAHQLVDIFTIIGAPSILQSGNGRQFSWHVICELKKMWPELKLVHGKLSHGSDPPANQEVHNTIMTWMMTKESTHWAENLKFIQFMKNRSFQRDLNKSPYEAMFGCKAKVGLGTSSLPNKVIDKVCAEEDLEKYNREIERSANLAATSQNQSNDVIVKQKVV